MMVDEAHAYVAGVARRGETRRPRRRDMSKRGIGMMKDENEISEIMMIKLKLN